MRSLYTRPSSTSPHSTLDQKHSKLFLHGNSIPNMLFFLFFFFVPPGSSFRNLHLKIRPIHMQFSRHHLIITSLRSPVCLSSQQTNSEVLFIFCASRIPSVCLNCSTAFKYVIVLYCSDSLTFFLGWSLHFRFLYLQYMQQF